MAPPVPESDHPEMSGLQVYIRLISYLRYYWGIFLLSVLGLVLFSAMEIVSVDLFGYTINAISTLSGEEAAPTSQIINIDKGLTAGLAEKIGGENAVMESRWIIPLLMFLIAVVRGLGFCWFIICGQKYLINILAYPAVILTPACQDIWCPESLFMWHR